MNNVLEYKGYFATVEYSPEDKVLFGKISGLKDLVNFESDSLERLEDAFHEAVDDYLSFCQDIGQEPDKPYKGAFNVRLSPELHRRAAMVAASKQMTLNSFVAESISKALQDVG